PPRNDNSAEISRRGTMRVVRRAFVFACVLMVAAPAHAAWDAFQIIEWQPRNAAQWRTLRVLGVTAAAVVANRDGNGTPLDQQTAVLRADIGRASCRER